MNMAEGINTEAIQAGLKAIKVIRCGVRDLFKTLAEGTTNNAANQTGIQTSHENGSLASTGTQYETQFLSDLQQIIANLNNRVRELESSCTLLAHSSSQVNLNVGNLALINQDPAFERSPIYSNMVTSYRWCDKVVEYATHANAMLSQMSLRRTNYPYSAIANLAGNRPRFPPVYLRRSTGHNSNVQQVNHFCMNLQRLFQDMNIELERPFGAPAVLKITLERVLKAVIVLRGLIIEWIMVKAYHEDFSVEGKSSIDVWSESRYDVFRKVTNHANAAMLHFYSPVHPELAVRSFFPCRKCECRLQDNLPPTWRDLRTLEPYHELCRP